MAGFEQAVGQMRAKKASSASDQTAHRSSSSTRCVGPERRGIRCYKRLKDTR